MFSVTWWWPLSAETCSKQILIHTTNILSCVFFIIVVCYDNGMNKV
jgi:hypothetical protein